MSKVQMSCCFQRGLVLFAVAGNCFATLLLSMNLALHILKRRLIHRSNI